MTALETGATHKTVNAYIRTNATQLIFYEEFLYHQNISSYIDVKGTEPYTALLVLRRNVCCLLDE